MCYTGFMRRFACVLSILLVALPLISERQYLRLATDGNSLHPQVKASEYFCRICGWETDGELHVRLYDNGQLGSGEDLMLQLRYGGVAFALLSFQELESFVPALESADKQLARRSFSDQLAWCTGHWDELKKALGDRGLLPLSVFLAPTLCLYSNTSQLPENLDGMTVGIPWGEFGRKLAPALGANMLEAQRGDASSLLGDHAADVMADTFLDFCLSDNWAFARSIRLFRQGSRPVFLVASMKSMEQLPEHQRIIIQNAARQASLYGDSLMERTEQSWKEQAKREKLLVEDHEKP